MGLGEFVLRWPGKVVFGVGQLACLGQEAKALGRRALLVTTRDLSALGVTKRAQELLEKAGVGVCVFEEVQPDPTSGAVDEAAELVRAEKCDQVVALGGGSAIDCGKGIAVAATHEGPVWDYVTYTGADAKPVTTAVLPVIAVPTTAGTGSEVSLGTVLGNPDEQMKAALLSPYVYPRVALVDPELTFTMPRAVTAMTGFDALTHGMESYLNAVKSNPASELIALDAASRAAHYLPRVVTDGTDRAAREQMSWAATSAGLAMALSNVTVAHAMGLPLGARLHVAHGLGLSRLLPVVLEHSWRAQPVRCAALADAVGAAKSGMSDEEKSQALVEWLKQLVGQIGLAEQWSGAAISDEMLEVLTDDVFRYMGRPVEQHRPVFDRGEIREIYEKALRT